MSTYKQLAEKQKELIIKLNRLCEYQHESIESGKDADYEEVFDVKLTKIRQLESECKQIEEAIETKLKTPKKFTYMDGYRINTKFTRGRDCSENMD